MDLSLPLPLFPLPNVLLYPDAMLPLHVFEPRYVQMVEDMKTSGSDLIVLGLLETGWEDGYFDRPAVHPIAGLGKVLSIKPAAEGRFNLLVQGVQRVEVEEELASDRLYRRVKVAPVEEVHARSDEERDQLTDALKNELIEFADGSLILRANAGLGYMADLLTVALPLDMDRKQELFGNLDVFQRARNVLEAVQAANHRRRSLRNAKSDKDDAKWN